MLTTLSVTGATMGSTAATVLAYAALLFALAFLISSLAALYVAVHIVRSVERDEHLDYDDALLAAEVEADLAEADEDDEGLL